MNKKYLALVGLIFTFSSNTHADGFNDRRQDMRQDHRQDNRMDRRWDNRYWGKPAFYRANAQWYRWKHPLASAVAFSIFVNELGTLQNEKGQDVIVVGNGGKVKETYVSKDNQVIIVTY
ncbi:conserved hypothetical protein [Photobacterium leiognathi lrivu.4.1]|uniref:Uncharacterized protein n=1 Tax=Photobacterium leiognathi lrivu.4.1 TaxID=1248232 RepID=V5H3Q1_PHOLE|nr:hypothetical protein [Photobacterium leiognathi]GAD31672.1 conserved hypothetical protein [Photobacterium leiognathi lrivu.4.1]